MCQVAERLVIAINEATFLNARHVIVVIVAIVNGHTAWVFVEAVLSTANGDVLFRFATEIDLLHLALESSMEFFHFLGLQWLVDLLIDFFLRLQKVFLVLLIPICFRTH